MTQGKKIHIVCQIIRDTDSGQSYDVPTTYSFSKQEDAEKKAAELTELRKHRKVRYCVLGAYLDC